jgi:acyl carrier protein
MIAGRLDDAQILDGIATVVRREIGFAEPISAQSRLLEDLGLDSLTSLTLALELENHFRVRLDEESGIETVADLVAAIRSHLDD